MIDISDISVLGCGWLGLPLAEALVKKGYHVKGSTTTPEKLSVLKEKGIEPYIIDLSCAPCRPALEQFLESDLLIINFPPKGQDGQASYLLHIRKLLQALQDSPVSHVLFISSTSVYPNLNRIVTEEDTQELEKLEEHPLLEAEQLVQQSAEWLTTVVRFGGLVGPGRNPGKFLAGKKDVANPEAPVNLIHQKDCIEILLQIIQQNKWEKVYNACADKHPHRREFYTHAAEMLGLEPPQFLEQTETSFKIISNQKLTEDLSYAFTFPDPMQFQYEEAVV